MTAVPATPPEPLVPAEVDLVGMAFMPLDVARVLDSDLFALSTGEEFKAAVALWCKSWTQVPAGSLPNNDRVLAHLSGTHSRWAKLKAQALHGWLLCADGRLYHPVIAEKALVAWAERQTYLERQAADTERKQAHREQTKGMRAQLQSLGVTVPWNETVAVMRRLIDELTQAGHADHGSDSDAPVTRTGASAATDLSPAIKREVKVKVKDLNQEHVPHRDAPDDASGEKGAPPGEQGEGQSHTTPNPVQPASGSGQARNRQARPDLLAGFDEFYGVYPRRQKRAEAEQAWRKLNPSPALRRTIIEALAKHRLQDSWTREGGQFVPLPASWLNARRWEDELEVETGVEACPAQAIVRIYHELCSAFDPVTVVDDTLQGLLNERWNEHPMQRDLEFWKDFFETAKRVQQVYYRGQHRKPYLEALVCRQNFRDIVEGRTHA
jgi:hypothetical protein